MEGKGQSSWYVTVRCDVSDHLPHEDTPEDVHLDDGVGRKSYRNENARRSEVLEGPVRRSEKKSASVSYGHP